MKIIGVMSGTSADGLDIVLCEITEQSGTIDAKILAGTTIPYDYNLRQRILSACEAKGVHTPQISALHTALGILIGDQVREFLDQHNTTAELIASHGQTIWHEVDANGNVQSTLQIGSAAHIAERTGLTTIHDFRSRDVAAGGQGAPLTAFVDSLLLRHPVKTRAVQNIGGIGNVTILPPQSDDMIAFDTGAGNVLIDAAMYFLTEGAQHYDDNGELGASGTIDNEWLNQLLQHDYYHRPPPKTTGRELFTADYVLKLVETGQNRGLHDADIIATLTALTAKSITHAITSYSPYQIDEMIVGGGGSRNSFLMRLLEEYLPDCDVLTHDDIGLDSEYKEGLVFALLGWHTWHNRTGTLPQQTGAAHASVPGSITPGDNYLNLLQTLMRDLNLC